MIRFNNLSQNLRHSIKQIIALMIKEITKKLNNRHQEAQQRKPIHDDWLEPPTMPEDIFLRKGIKHYWPAIPDNGSNIPFIRSSSHSSTSTGSSWVDNQDDQYHRSSRQVLVVFIPDGLKPGEKVRVSYPDGRIVQATVPPRSQWGFQNRNGKPRPFFKASEISSLSHLP
mmetsp:Transcript_12939/g.27477  ORF Transcript_12939/g.27477 Transcript_12939/m.27477 type:complete len:170 (-) Transcript_12939:464-973(-)